MYDLYDSNVDGFDCYTFSFAEIESCMIASIETFYSLQSICFDFSKFYDLAYGYETSSLNHVNAFNLFNARNLAYDKNKPVATLNNVIYSGNEISGDLYASDDIGIRKIEYFIDGIQIYPLVDIISKDKYRFSYIVHDNLEKNATHELKVQVYDRQFDTIENVRRYRPDSTIVAVDFYVFDVSINEDQNNENDLNPINPGDGELPGDNILPIDPRPNFDKE